MKEILVRQSLSLTRAETIFCLVLLSVIFFGLFGYVFFTLNPENLVRFASVAGLHRPAMIVFAFLQSTLFIVGALWLAFRVLPKSRALVLFAAVSAVGFFAEYIGITTGLPFGSYHYTDLMGPKLGEHVPVVIPPSWFAIALPVYLVVSHFLKSPLERVLVASWFVTAWDLCLDPAMSDLLPYWVWADSETAFFYKSPFMNFVGWYLTSCVIFVLFEFLAPKDASQRKLPFHGSSLYFANYLMPAGMCLFAGEGLAPAVAFLALLPVVGYIFVRARMGSMITAEQSQRAFGAQAEEI